MGKKPKSVFTDNLENCFVCGSRKQHLHHCIKGSRRKLSDKYGFVIPVCVVCHTRIHDNRELDLKYIRMAQEYYESNHGSREEFRQSFGKSWL